MRDLVDHQEALSVLPGPSEHVVDHPGRDGLRIVDSGMRRLGPAEDRVGLLHDREVHQPLFAGLVAVLAVGGELADAPLKKGDEQ